MSLNATGPWQLDFIRYQDNARTHDWKSIIEKENDAFVTHAYGDREKLIKDLYYIYSYTNVVPYFFYKVFHLKGVSLWLSQKAFLSYMGVASILIIYLLTCLFYSSWVGLMAGALAVFSPHIWITFNFDGGIMRAYNFFFSLLTIYLFCLFIRRKKNKFFLYAYGFFMGLNFLFFHIGSFMAPIVLFLYSFVLWLKNKDNRPLKSFFLALLVSIVSSSLLHMLHCRYFNLPYLSPFNWFKSYFAKGPEASHSVSGLVFFNFKKLWINFIEHIAGVFINGKTSGDWHYIISPPGVPYVYNYVAGLFFLIGLIFSFARKRSKNLLFLIWFFVFFVIYSFIIVVRQKNIFWEVPAVYILSAQGAFLSAVFLFKKIRKFSRKFFVLVLSAVMIVSSIGWGAWNLYHKLPGVNFYDGGAYMGIYKVYQFIRGQGLTKDSKIIFTMPEMQVGNMMMRLFVEGEADILCLSQIGVTYPPEEGIWMRTEEELFRDSTDKLFYCFLRYDNHLGNIYVTDDHYQEVFKKIHPEARVHEIRGLDNLKLWDIYVIGAGQKSLDIAPVAPNKKDEPPKFKDRIIGSSFKILAKGFITAMNVDKVKASGVKKINKMSQNKFESKYAKIYAIIKDLPEPLVNSLGFTEKMTKEKAILSINSLDKKKMLELVNQIPDKFIADKFRGYLTEQKHNIAKINIGGQIREFWAKITKGSSE